MSRNMIQANSTIFGSLDEYCANAGDPIRNSGTPRWVATTAGARQFLQNAELIKLLSFSPSLKLARFDIEDRSFFVTIGFKIGNCPSDWEQEDLDGGRLTVFISELKPIPSASTIQIRDVIEVSDKNASPEYEGHDYVLVSTLYPSLQVFSTKKLAQEETFRAFFLICLSFTNRPDHWINNQLAEVLNVIADTNLHTVPYETLCRSILDKDPGALFLALYRCLESLYAYTQSLELMNKLGISKQWSEMAQTLEDVLGWYPREEPSLEALLEHAVERDLRGIADVIHEEIPPNARIHAFVAKRIYQFRNALVHYRPFHQVHSLERVDWNRLCQCMALLMFHIYGSIESQLRVPVTSQAATVKVEDKPTASLGG